MSAAAIERYFSVMSETGRNPGNLRFELNTMFDGITMENRAVLDIGAGDGSTSLYAACAGAKRVVSLEPEAAGSTSGTQKLFEQSRDRLGADNVVMFPETLQAFVVGDQRFDVVISRASINHLDEDACARLHYDPEARRTYSALLGKLAELAAPGATLLVSDCTRSNLFASVGLKNPLCPTIEWTKHQPPEVWVELLSEVGFVDERIRWLTLNTLRRPGQWIFGNRFAAYFTTSSFLLRMRRA